MNAVNVIHVVTILGSIEVLPITDAPATTGREQGGE